MSKPTIEEMAADVTDLLVRNVEARTRGESPRETTAQLLLDLIRAVVDEMRPEPTELVMQRVVFNAINKARNPGAGK